MIDTSPSSIRVFFIIVLSIAWLIIFEQVDGYVKVRLGGACASCAMSTITLRDGIQKKLMMEIPDVKGVIQVL